MSVDEVDDTTPVTFGGTQVRDDGEGPLLLAHRFQLTVVAGPDKGAQVDVEGPRLTMGASSHNDLALSDTTVSRCHCEVAVKSDRYVVRDLGSTNGTEVNGTPIVEAMISPGSRIRVGETEVLFEPKKRWERITSVEEASFGELYGGSDLMRRVFGMLKKVSRTDLSCVIIGETGTGKELAARALHSNGARTNGPMVVVDCGAISSNLVESELFGHERGAFTGADKQRAGAFELADGGTIFLDEIGELPLELQPKLLRALERREVKRLGASRVASVNVRVIAATHRNLMEMVQSGKFREDLYYRLAEVIVPLPALRDRIDDIPVIAQHLLAAEGSGQPTLAPEAIRALMDRTWPGNVRELRNVIRRAAALSSGEIILPDDLRTMEPAAPASEPPGGRPNPAVGDDLPIKEAREQWVAPMEREYLTRLVKRCHGDLERASTEAGIHRKSLERLLRQHGIKAADLRR